MIVTVDTMERREFFVPQAWRPTVMSLLQNIEDWVMAGAGRSVQPRLIDAGSKPIAVIKVVREYYGMALKQGKEYVINRAPCSLPALPHITAEKMLMDMRRAGATVELPSAVEQLGDLAKNHNAARAAIAALNEGEDR